MTRKSGRIVRPPRGRLGGLGASASLSLLPPPPKASSPPATSSATTSPATTAATSRRRRMTRRRASSRRRRRASSSIRGSVAEVGLARRQHERYAARERERGLEVARLVGRDIGLGQVEPDAVAGLEPPVIAVEREPDLAGRPVVGPSECRQVSPGWMISPKIASVAGPLGSSAPALPFVAPGG